VASEAEKRLRDKADAELRRQFPDARIIHEFDVGGCRLDIAAICPDRMILAEIKSERDVLDRLPRQLAVSVEVASEVWLCIPPQHVTAIECRRHSQIIDEDHKIPIRGGYTYAQNPNYIPHLWLVELQIETEDGFVNPSGRPRQKFGVHPTDRMLDSRALLRLLLKHELVELTKCPARWTCEQIIRKAFDELTGRQIRQGVYTAIRRRVEASESHSAVKAA